MQSSPSYLNFRVSALQPSHQPGFLDAAFMQPEVCSPCTHYTTCVTSDMGPFTVARCANAGLAP